MEFHKLRMALLVNMLVACTASPNTVPTSAPTPILTHRSTATPFPVIGLEDYVLPTHEPLPEQTVILPTSPPIDVEELFQVEIPETNCISQIPDDWMWYEVEPGDTPEDLAERTGVSIEKLNEVNCLDENSPLIAQSLLFIPAE